MSELYTFEGDARPIHIAQELCRLAKASGVAHRAVINDVFMLAAPHDKPRSVLAMWYRHMEHYRDVWSTSPLFDGERDAMMVARSTSLQANADKHVDEGASLNLADPATAVVWIEGFVPIADQISVNVDWTRVFNLLEQAGYSDGSNQYPLRGFNSADSDEFARWLIAYFMRAIRRGGTYLLGISVVPAQSAHWRKLLRSRRT